MRQTKAKLKSPINGFLILLLIVALAYALISSFCGVEPVKKFLDIFEKSDKSENDDYAIQETLKEVSEKNPEAAEYVANFNGIKDYDLDLDLSSEVTVGTIPYYTQWDSRWGYCQYGEGLIGYTGCGPTALSMVAMGLTGDGTLTPAYIADFATREGYCVPGNGTAWLLFSEGAEKLGLTARELPLSETTMRDELEDGHPIICVMGPGHFTETGHYIVIVSCDDEGFQVYDPNRPSNCKTWSYDEIYGEIRNLWSYCGAKD